MRLFRAWAFLPLFIALGCSVALPTRQSVAAGLERTGSEGDMAGAAGSRASLSSEERQWLDRHDGQIRIGITVIPPQVLMGVEGYEGYAIDYIRLLERKIGCRFVLSPYPTWNEVIEAAKERRNDMIFAAQETAERREYLLFTAPYLELPNMIVVRKDTKGGRICMRCRGGR